MDTHTVMCGFTGVLCSYILICASLKKDTCFVVCCCADVSGLVVTRRWVKARLSDACAVICYLPGMLYRTVTYMWLYSNVMQECVATGLNISVVHRMFLTAFIWVLVSRMCVDRVVYSYRVISRRCFFKVASLLESPESPMLHTPRQPGHAVDREEASSSRLARVLSRTVAKAFLVNVILLYGVSFFFFFW